MGSKREGVMLAYPVDEKKLSKMPDQVIYQRKLNGERARVEWHNDKPIIFSSCGNEMPFFKEVKRELIENRLHNIPLDGEFYNHGMEREEIHSICSRRVNPSPDENKLSFHAFDIVNKEETQYMRDVYLHAVVPKHLTFIKLVESKMALKDDLFFYADQFVKEGYEGAIIRNPRALYTPRKCNFMLKFKPTEKDVYPIVGYQEEEDIYGWMKGRLGSVLVKDDDGHVFSVGTGKALDADGRNYWWKNRDKLVGLYATVKHSTILTVNGFPTCTSLLKIEIGDTPNGLHETS